MKTSGRPSTLRTVGVLTLMVALSTFLLISYNTVLEAATAEAEDPTNLILQEVMPEATEFKPVLDEQGKPIYYEAFDDEGNPLGYGFIFRSPGMWGSIKYAGGMDLDFKLTGMKVLAQGETPGLGSRIEEPWFQEQFKGLSVEDVKLKKEGGKVDAITGATTTSKAVVDAMSKEMALIIELAGG